MRKLTLCLVAVALCVVSASAQSRPNFAGHWTLQAAASEPFFELGSRPMQFLNDSRSSLADEFTISQDATKLTVEFAGPPNAAVFSYRLDGTESRNTPPPTSAAEVISTATWKDGKLVIVSTEKVGSPSGAPTTAQLTQSLSLAADGTLVVESTSRIRTTTRIYKKK